MVTVATQAGGIPGREASGTSGQPPEAGRVGDILRGYAHRGMFRGFAAKPPQGRRWTFNILWHYNRQYGFVLDLAARRVSFPGLLPGIPARSPMAGELKDFLNTFSTDAAPEHRRIDGRLGTLAVGSRQGAFTVAIEVNGGHYEYCTRKLVHLAHEVFMVFLWDGPYYEYRVQNLGLDPDGVWP